MKTFADIKRRLTPGARLVCVGHTNRPELIGTERVIEKTQTNAFTWRPPAGSDKPSWTYLPKAKGVVIHDANTFTMPIADGYGRNIGEHTVTLRFLEI